MRKGRKNCRFTLGGGADIDYKNIDLLKGYISESGKIVPSRITGVRAYFQRRLTNAIKIARYLALIPYCDRH